jgi:peptidoglycan hydrolase-like protein with peptidoglycan-binding domain
MVRYVSNWGNGKNITPFEAKRLSDGGIDIVLVAEWDIDTWLGGYATGHANGLQADAMARSVGMPAGRPIYFAVDDDVTLGGRPVSANAIGRCNALKAYLQGAADALGGWQRVGCYASYFGLDWLYNNTPLQYGWNTLAWSGGNWHPRAQLRQETFNVWIEGGNYDGNHAFAADFGQWRVGGVTTPAVQVLRLGDQGDAVKSLQQSLNKLNAKPQLVVDGAFGPATDTAVRQFQGFLKIAVDGAVGEKTWNGIHYFLALAAAPKPPVQPPVVAPKPPVKLVTTVPAKPAPEPFKSVSAKSGDTGALVGTIQNALNVATGGNLAVNGVYDAATTAAVKNLQNFSKLPATGIVDGNTMATLQYFLSLKK